MVMRSLELIFEYLRLGTSMMREHQVDIIQARTGLPELLVGLWLAKWYHKPLVFQNSFPRELGHKARFERGPFPWLGSLIYWLDIVILYLAMRMSDHTLAISQTMTDIWKKRGIKHISPFPLGADTRVHPNDVTPMEAPPDTVIYFGAMERYRELKFLLDTFVLVIQEIPTAHLLMVGDASQSGLEEYADHIGIRASITFIGRVPRADVPRYIRASRCSISPIPPIPMYILSSPTKVIESLAMAVPVVANCEINDQREIIEQCEGGYTPPYEQQAMAEAVIELLRNPEESMRRGKAGREYIEANRGYDVLSRQLVQCYNDLLAQYGVKGANVS